MLCSNGTVQILNISCRSAVDYCMSCCYFIFRKNRSMYASFTSSFSERKSWCQIFWVHISLILLRLCCNLQLLLQHLVLSCVYSCVAPYSCVSLTDFTTETTGHMKINEDVSHKPPTSMEVHYSVPLITKIIFPINIDLLQVTYSYYRSKTLNCLLLLYMF